MADEKGKETEEEKLEREVVAELEAEESSGNGNGHDDDEDLVETSLEQLASRARDALAGESLDGEGFERSVVLSQFVIAADLHFLIDEVMSFIEGAKQLLTGIAPMAKMAAMGAAASAAQAGGGEGHVPPMPDLQPAGDAPTPGGAPSWVSQVLQQDQMQVAKKRVAVDIRPGDRGPLGEEHRALILRMQQENWTLEQLNEALIQCDRPAEAVIIEAP
jgi:hypothetical protein